MLVNSHALEFICQQILMGVQTRRYFQSLMIPEDYPLLQHKLIQRTRVPLVLAASVHV